MSNYNILDVFLLVFMFIIYILIIFKISNKKKFVVLSIFIFLFKLLFVLVFIKVYPTLILPPDGQRYFYEIQEISKSPWKWNPVLGEGPGYSVTPKMGMSYVYGWILFFFKTNSLFSVLIINVFISSLTSLLVYVFSKKINNNETVGLLVLVLATINPEMLFWNARVLRESFLFLLIIASVLLAISIYEKNKVKNITGFVVILFLIFISRIQLIFIPIIFFLILFQSQIRRNKSKLLLILPISTVIIFAFPSILEQIISASGKGAIERMKLFFIDFNSAIAILNKNIGEVLSLNSTQAYGVLGWIIAPLFIVLIISVLITIIFPSYFFENKVIAYAALFTIIIFSISLAVTGNINVRFRSAIIPIALPILTSFLYRITKMFIKKSEK